MARKHYRRTNSEIILDIYREMYANATPSANFDYLMENARRDDEGRAIIPYMDYYLDEESQKEIINKHLNKNKVPAVNAKSIEFTVWLGCSPTSVPRNNNDNNG